MCPDPTPMFLKTGYGENWGLQNSTVVTSFSRDAVSLPNVLKKMDQCKEMKLFVTTNCMRS